MKIHNQWLKIMRLAKVESLRKEIEILSQSHEREVDRKDAVIQMLDKDLEARSLARRGRVANCAAPPRYAPAGTQTNPLVPPCFPARAPAANLCTPPLGPLPRLPPSSEPVRGGSERVVWRCVGRMPRSNISWRSAAT